MKRISLSKYLIVIPVLLLCGFSLKPSQMPTESIPYVPYSSVTPSATTPSPTNISPSIGEVTPTISEVKNEDQVIFKVSNINGCGFTDTSNFTLDNKYLVTKIYTWYSWESSEKNVEYTMTKDKTEIASGLLERSDCDPYQRQWCGAIDKQFNKELEKGEYILKLKNARVCQNSLSNNKGFIQIYAK
jgi:hypothetical protein